MDGGCQSWKRLVRSSLERRDTKDEVEYLLVSVLWKITMATLEQVFYICIDYTQQVYSYLYICMFNYSDIYWMCTENDLLENSEWR